VASNSASLARTQGGRKASALAPTEDAARGGEVPPRTDGACGWEYYPLARVDRLSNPTAVLEPALAGPRARLDAFGRLGARVSGSERAARAALATMVALAAGLVVAAAAKRSTFVPPGKGGFPGWMVGPFKGLGAFLPEGQLYVQITFTAVLVGMFCCYAVVLACRRHLQATWVIATLAALHALFLLGPPLALTDVFNYFNYARLEALHGINPYVEPPGAWPDDPSYPFATWHHLLSPYGPLFLLAMYPLLPLGLEGGYWVLKLATAAASAGCLALVWHLALRRGREPVIAVAFVGLNPLVMVFGLGGVHNDFFMVALILAGVAAVIDRRPAKAGAALVAAIAVKVSAGLALPFAFLGLERARRGAFVAGAAAVGAALAALSLAAFGFNGPGLDAQSTLATPLSPPNLLGLALGQGGATAPVRLAVQAAAVGAILVLLRSVWRGADWVTSAGWATLVLVLSLTWEMPWYVLWVLPFAALGHSRALRRATLALSVFLLVTLTPLTGALLSDVCHCNPADTQTGKRNAVEIRKYLK
jgi:hypothetical protein